MSCVTNATSQSIRNIHVPMLYEIICRELKKADPDVEGLAVLLNHYGITPVMVADHLLSLQPENKVKFFKEIEGQKKAKLTKVYNKLFEATKFKRQKMKMPAIHHLKYDPALEMEDEGD